MATRRTLNPDLDRYDPQRHVFLTDDGKLYMLRCPDCSRENWGPAVASGACAWCGRKADFKDLEVRVGKGIKIRRKRVAKSPAKASKRAGK